MKRARRIAETTTEKPALTSFGLVHIPRQIIVFKGAVKEELLPEIVSSVNRHPTRVIYQLLTGVELTGSSLPVDEFNCCPRLSLHTIVKKCFICGGD